ncbi:phosrestin-2-like isoform X1 [Pogonomyrmex barbatus]|uniref:Phosrestin-2-like isoform X1 n=1 Tax=Pogonomyrmex barbatus TaxID=144034 RepID=A0A6I9WFB8_9HYME|nr:phosrestin-2-like isoform X1 [Pogonomyrmex barbatus]XP_011637908.1 phosrestin-2-like isoform X1 [Pogonomyrmex barbatus]XP_011637909.1 phosrestin-2-like isoform X1 [Pogonomyrmex barbatus]XP_011637910.1 phosrestin-2-like isoform X1 [Pogonomyrmex barbatus]XP_011637911.1 phosrestin-2-like isoform X1 [Pogonomyrmex barbatus]XP_011637912.1 phosrestin-2-like isoform X1 [Pogonomyrmex barbatus]
MATNGSHVTPETTVIQSDDEEQGKELYPNTVEHRNITVENCDTKDERTTNQKEEEESHREEAKSDREQDLQVQPQMQQVDTRFDRKIDTSPDHISDSAFSSQRVYKKSSPNNKLTLYLASRDIIVSEAKNDNKLLGVLLVDPDYVREKKVYGQVTLTFRYGREDEEVMGLKFCNEAMMCLAQLYPAYVGAHHLETKSPLQEALIKRLGPNAHAFTIEIPSIAPPSVQLVPAKEYNGPPIGNSYDIRVYVAERADERLHRKTTVRMGIRVIQRATKPPLPSMTMYSVPPSQVPSTTSRIQGSRTRTALAENEIMEDDENVGPHAAVEKPFLLSDGRVRLEAKLDHAIYEHGDSINVHVHVSNNSSKSVRRIKVFVVQHVDVCMFSNGKFKNVVALMSSQEDCPLGPGGNLRKTYSLKLVKGTTKNWIALEDSYTKTGASLASTVANPRNGPDDRNVYTIYVSYYVKVKLLISAMGGEVSLKLPFTLMHSNVDTDLVGFPSPIREAPKEFGKSTNEITEKSDSSAHRNKENKLEAIKEQRESKVTDVDLIEHCEESDST